MSKEITQRLRSALEEIRTAIRGQERAEPLLESIDEAIASGDRERMRKALARFDRMDTIHIQKLREEEDEAAPPSDPA